MVSNITFSTAIVQDSITNELATSANIKDNLKPFSFLDFIVNTKVDYAPEEYNKFYLYYLKEWSAAKNNGVPKETETIATYVDFLKEITLTYSTQQELRFLSTLDFTDPIDLDIAIPFYTEKIRQIVLFYKNKRDDSKYIVERNKIKGTGVSIERSIYEKIYDYVFTSEENPEYNNLSLSLSALTTNLKIDIEEFVDTYSNYFDIPRVNNQTQEFNRSNINDIDVNIFFDTSDEVFKNEVFLTEIPIAINNAVNFNVTCSEFNPLYASTVNANTDNADLIRNCDELCGFGLEDKLSLKRKFIEKYVGVDFYYIDTTVSPPISGLLFKSEKPYANIQNLQTADTATVPSNQQRLLKDIGIFFKPDKTGLFKLQANKYTYDINLNQIASSNKVYIFPDPKIYGNVSVNEQEEYPLIFDFDFRHDLKNVSSSFAGSDPYVRSDEQTFSPYYAKEQSELKNYVTDDSIYLNFADIYNKGYITKYQTDIYGNEYALFKDEFGDSFKSIYEDDSYIKNLQLNGHTFFDLFEGYNFDYSATGIYTDFIRSGLSSHTVDIENSPSMVLSGTPYYLHFREFAPYQELDTSIPLGSLYSTGFNAFTTAVTSAIPSYFNNLQFNTVFVRIKEAGGFAEINNSVLPDPLFADFEDYPYPLPYYYTELIEGGISQLYPTIQRAYFPNILDEFSDPLLTETDIITVTDQSNADFGLDLKWVLSASDGYYDGGYFTDNQVFDEPASEYITGIAEGSTTVLSNLSGTDNIKAQIEKRNLQGKIYVKNQTYSHSSPLSTALYNIYYKYNSAVRTELYSTPKDLEVIYDNIIIETDNYLVFDKIVYDDGSFVDPGTKNTYYKRENNWQSFSNRFFNEKQKTITFCVTDTLSSLSASNTKPIYPNIYQLNITNNIITKLFPKTSDISAITSLSSIFSFSDFFDSKYNVNIVRVDTPVLTYNSFNEMYKLSFTGVDSNNLFHLFDYEFEIINGEVSFHNGKYYKQSKTLLTTNFSDPSTIFTNINTISGSYIINTTTGELIL